MREKVRKFFSGLKSARIYRKRFSIPVLPVIILILFLVGWFLGTGIVVIEPHSTKIYYHPIGFYRSSLSYSTDCYVNESSCPKLGLKWPVLPSFGIGKKDLKFNLPQLKNIGGWEINLPLRWPEIGLSNVGRFKEKIDHRDLDFERKLVIFSLDKETGDPKDKDRIFALIVKAEIEVTHWDLFTQSYSPETLNYYLKREGAPFRVDTIEYFKIVLLEQILKIVEGEGGFLVHQDEIDVYFKFLKDLIEKNPQLNSFDKIKQYLWQESPWIWVFGPGIYYTFLPAPHQLMSYIFWGVPGAKELHELILVQNRLEEIDQRLTFLREQKELFFLLTREELTQKAEYLLSSFEQKLTQTNQDLSSILSLDLLERAAQSFIEEKRLREDEKQAFLVLLGLEWEKTLLTNEKNKYHQSLEEVTEKIRKVEYLKPLINDYFWRLITKVVLEDPEIDSEQLKRKVAYPFLRNRELWQINPQELTVYGGKIKSFEISLKEVPLYLDGKVDEDFKYYHFFREK